jgi:putative ABC transport system ATP-binding protein
MALIELQDIKKHFGKGENRTEVLQDVDLVIEKGEFVAVMGPSGSGKSTLMNILGLLDSPSSGIYHLNGKPVARLKDRAQARIRREEIGFVFQSYNLIPRLTIQQNVELPMIYDRRRKKERQSRSMKLLKLVGIENRAKYRPSQISGGQLQRAAVARALANNPSILLADEPTGNLDSKSGAAVMALLKKLSQKGVTIVMVTHDSEVADYAQRVIHVKDGRIEVKR